MFTWKAGVTAVLLGIAATFLSTPAATGADLGRLVGPMHTQNGSIAWWGSAGKGQTVPIEATDPGVEWSIPQVGGTGEVRQGGLCLTIIFNYFTKPTLETCDGSPEQDFTTVVNPQKPTWFGLRSTTLVDPYATGTPEEIGFLGSTFFTGRTLQTFPVSSVTDYELSLMKPEAAPNAPAVSRLHGSDRFETSVAVAKAAFPSAGVPVVYIASGAAFPDAISAGPAAAAQNGPLLLTRPEALPAAVLAEVKRLAPKKIVVVGGTAAVSDAVSASLRAVQPNVVRVAGSDRFETSRQIAKYAFPAATGAYFASGMNFPDALSAASGAAASGQPVILVSGFGAADSATTSHLKNTNAKSATIVGGSAVISAALDPSLRSAGLAVTRIGGYDRFDTSHLVNSRSFTSASTVYIASGVDFPDALSGSAIAGAAKAPLFLSRTTCLPRAVSDDIVALGASKVVLIGGTAALAPDIAAYRTC